MPEDPESGSTASQWSFGRIVEGLQGQPPLLVALGGGVLLLGMAGVIGGAAADQAWMLIVAVVLLVLAGLAAWLAVTMRASRPASRASFTPEIKGRNVTARDEGRIGSEVGTGADDISPKIEASGDIEASGRGQIGSAGGERRSRRRQR
jgi:hypothetical protein